MVLLNPYSGDQQLTEGLDWEAEQGRAAYGTIMGTAEHVKVFFEKTEGESNEEDQI